MLSDPTSFAVNNIGVTNVIQKSCFPVINVSQNAEIADVVRILLEFLDLLNHLRFPTLHFQSSY